MSWTLRSACGTYIDLPWTAETRPSDGELDAMERICGTCPVLNECARYAGRTNNGHGAGGGFYAGVWLPWLKDEREPRDLRAERESRDLRARARRMLRQIEKKSTVQKILSS